MQVQILMRIDLEQSLVAARACVGRICETNCLETTAGNAAAGRQMDTLEVSFDTLVVMCYAVM